MSCTHAELLYIRNHDFMTEQDPALFKHPAIFVGPGGETIIECEKGGKDEKCETHHNRNDLGNDRMRGGKPTSQRAV